MAGYMIGGEYISKEDFHDILNIIRTIYGYDFSNYTQASFKRRMTLLMKQAGLKTVYDLKHQLVNHTHQFKELLNTLTVNVTEMFRDPLFYKALREQVLPVLASYPSIQIWHPGCATGEEVYSMAILLKECGLLERSRIYATDLNVDNLRRAQEGIMPISQMKYYTHNYIATGGKRDFSDYYTARYDHAILLKELRKRITFSQHNLVTDSRFNSFQLICCRNVLIYFNRQLQNRVINLFHDSLLPLGYLALGSKESLLFTDKREQFETVDLTQKLFRRTQ
jgi:chemotaxis protein methyltransferase CheR